ncbi:MAG: hypothetical protein Q9170_004087 [Blastenia crenularia]
MVFQAGCPGTMRYNFGVVPRVAIGSLCTRIDVALYPRSRRMQGVSYVELTLKHSHTSSTSHTDRLSLPLSNNAIVTGLRTPSLPSPPPTDPPLIVALHGEAYSAEYYNIPTQSVLPLSRFLQIPFISLNRPGYLDRTALPVPIPEGSIYCQEEGKYLHHEILWKRFMVLAHSLSVPMTIVAVALNALEEEKSYSWQASSSSTRDPDATHLALPISLRDEIMLCSQASLPLCDPEIFEVSERLDTRAGMAEFQDGCGIWALCYRDKYAKHVTYLVMYNLASDHRLWHVNVRTLEGFAAAFMGSIRLDKGVVLGPPHCMAFGRVA